MFTFDFAVPVVVYAQGAHQFEAETGTLAAHAPASEATSADESIPCVRGSGWSSLRRGRAPEVRG